MSPCGAQGVAVEAVAFVVAVAFAVEVDTGYPVLARVAVVHDGVAEQLAGVVGMLAAAVFQTACFKCAEGLQLGLPPMVVVEACAVGVGIGVVAVEAAFVERGHADVVALVGIADACREACGEVVVVGVFGIDFAVMVCACRGIEAAVQRPFFFCADLVVDGGGIDGFGECPASEAVVVGIDKAHCAALFIAQVVAQTALAGGLVDVLFARDVQAGIELP